MTQAEFSKRQDRASRETLVIKKTDEGYRVYPPGNPARNYLVAGNPDDPTCTCPDFDGHRDDPDWRCKHVLAVAHHLGWPNGDPCGGDETVDAEERRAIQEESRERTVEPSPTLHQGPSQMVLKRSVSPDGRIDSLSVEICCPVDPAFSPDVARSARQVLKLQSEIVEGFLGRGNGHSGNGDRPRNGNGDTVEAKLLRIGGLDTRYGRRLFISVQVNGDTLKLFGSKKQLAEAIEAAGFPSRAERVEEGVQLDLPCRVTTKPSEDRRYENVDHVFPAARRGDHRPAR